jgi:hypothetical protein
MNPVTSRTHQTSGSLRSVLPQSIEELTQALQIVLQQYLPFTPEDVSVFFGGAEVYRYCPSDDSVPGGATTGAIRKRPQPAVEP